MVEEGNFACLYYEDTPFFTFFYRLAGVRELHGEAWAC